MRPRHNAILLLLLIALLVLLSFVLPGCGDSVPYRVRILADSSVRVMDARPGYMPGDIVNITWRTFDGQEDTSRLVRAVILNQVRKVQPEEVYYPPAIVAP